MPTASADERARRCLWIGEWSVDPGANGLSRGSDTVRIEPKAMDVLMLLAHRVGSVVSREELFAAVWPGVVVGDECRAGADQSARGRNAQPSGYRNARVPRGRPRSRQRSCLSAVGGRRNPLVGERLLDRPLARNLSHDERSTKGKTVGAPRSSAAVRHAPRVTDPLSGGVAHFRLIA